jgi:hypothetical protein
VPPQIHEFPPSLFHEVDQRLASSPTQPFL